MGIGSIRCNNTVSVRRQIFSCVSGHFNLIQRPLRILVSDDDVFSSKFVIDTLNQFGFDTCHATSNKGALKKLKKNADYFDILLIDLTMSIADGITTILTCREELKLAIPIIGLSSGIDVHAQREIILAGASHIIPKPLNIKDIIKLFPSSSICDQSSASIFHNIIEEKSKRNDFLLPQTTESSIRSPPPQLVVTPSTPKPSPLSSSPIQRHRKSSSGSNLYRESNLYI